MAESFAAAYGNTKWSAIYSSPLQRAVTTAEPLAREVGLPVLARDGFAEIDYGEWDGLSASQVAVFGRVPKNFTTPARPEATFGLCWRYSAVSHLSASSQ